MTGREFALRFTAGALLGPPILYGLVLALTGGFSMLAEVLR
ncbi:hypothetical protein [Ferrovibrio sp.]